MLWAALKMMFGLGALLAFLYFLVRLAKRMEFGRRLPPTDTGIQLLTSKMIAPQKYISLVEIGGEVLALGVSNQQITFLTKIENKELVRGSLAELAGKAEPLWWLRNWPGLQKKFKVGPMEMRNEK